MNALEIALLAVAAVPVTYVIAELCARAYLSCCGGWFVWTPQRRIHMEIDRETLPSLEPLVRFEVNSEGERGAEPPPPGADCARILVAGGSAGECYYLDQESSWPEVLRSELARPDALARMGVGGVHVGNVARSLVPCESIHEMLTRILPRYRRLDVALLMVGASDLVSWLENRTPDRIDRRALPLSAKFGTHPAGPFGWKPRETACKRIVAGLVQSLRKPIERRQRAGKTLAKNRAMRAGAKELIESVPSPAPMLDDLGLWLGRCIDTLRATGARVIVVRQPWFRKDFEPHEQAVMWNFGAGRPYEADLSTYYSHAVVRELMAAVDETCARVAREHGAEEVDLMPILEPSLETFYDFYHFTPKGAADVGRAVAEAVLAKHPTPAEPVSSA